MDVSDLDNRGGLLDKYSAYYSTVKQDRFIHIDWVGNVFTAVQDLSSNPIYRVGSRMIGAITSSDITGDFIKHRNYFISPQLMSG